MTGEKSKIVTSQKRKSAAISTLLLFCITVSIVFSENIADSVRIGLKLCASSIIPAVFPFMVLSDAIVAYASFEKSGFLKGAFERLFKINGAALSAFISGAICGFPLGVKSSVDLYQSGVISKDEAERLIGFSNNTGPAFLIAGVGASMRGSIADGVLLYASLLLSAVAVGALFGINRKKSDFCTVNTRQNFDLVSSIKNSGINTLYICSFIVFFSVVVGLIKMGVSDARLLSITLPFLELGNASAYLSNCGLSKHISLSLTGFATAFSGISVHMQSLVFIKETDISTRLYFKMKLLQGVISSAIILIFENILFYL